MHYQGISVIWVTQPHTLASEENHAHYQAQHFQLCSPLHPLYGLETAVFLEPQINCLQSFVMRCLCSILEVSLRDGQRDTSIKKTAHIQRVFSMLTESCLRLWGHIMRMPEDRLPRQLLVRAPAHGRRSAEGQKLRWNDLVLRDLQFGWRMKGTDPGPK